MHDIKSPEADTIVKPSTGKSLTSVLINELIEALNSSGIPYCHWKSNFSLAQALAGETDLDLLVDLSFLPQAIKILDHFKFKRAMVIRQQDPGVYHYYGFELQTGRLIHVHLYSHVLTGESFIKSHSLPLEKMLLEKTYQIENIKVTDKPAELVLFILRNYIKYGSLLDIIYLLKSRNAVNEELSWLQPDIYITDALILLKRFCPVIDEKIFLRGLQLLQNKGSLLMRVIQAQKVRRRLRIYSRYSRVRRIQLYLKLLSGYFWSRIRGHSKNKILATGGAVIAFVGPEATGKSTLVSESENWLNKIFSVTSIHAGKPPSSFLTYPLNVFLPLLRKLLPALRTSRLEGHVSINSQSSVISAESHGSSSLLYALRSVALAWDRRKLLVKAKRYAANGKIVICDRYPSATTGAMDSPRLTATRASKKFGSFIYNKLAHLETRLYKQIPVPDLVLRLKVSVETAKQRNKDRIKKDKESNEYVESRHLKNKDWQVAGKTSICDIDTNQSLDETILLVKKRIWESL